MGIAEMIRILAGTGQQLYCEVCAVESVDMTERTCVLVPIAEKANLEGVRLQADLDMENGLVMFPAKESNVICAYIQKDEAVIIAYSEIELIECKIGNITYKYDKDGILLNGDQYGGLTQHDNLVVELNKTKTVVDAIKNVLTTWIPVAQDGGAALKALATSTLASLNTGNYANLSNKKIKHG